MDKNVCDLFWAEKLVEKFLHVPHSTPRFKYVPIPENEEFQINCKIIADITKVQDEISQIITSLTCLGKASKKNKKKSNCYFPIGVMTHPPSQLENKN